MKKLSLFSIALMLCSYIMAGGIITNANQSAMYPRLLARDATLGIDAVYYNPAGLTLLPNDGLFISINNQTLGQSRTVISDYDTLNQKKYTGDISAPFFPGFYAVYKKGKIAGSFGFNPVGGGGGGTYEKGLPSFEYPVSDLVPGLIARGQDVRGYQMDAYLKGTSVYLGYQLNFSYQINDMISVALGGRYVRAKDTYKGHLKDIAINLADTAWIGADVFFAGSALQARGVADNMGLIIGAGYGSLTLEQAEGASIISTADRAEIEANLTASGVDVTDITVSETQAAFNGLATVSSQKAYLLGDQEVDVERTASGFTPIISVNIKPSDKLNIALKYEFNTKLEFVNKTNTDVPTEITEEGDTITMFPDGEKKRYDIPALLAGGITYRPFEKLLVSAGFHYYFDQNANWNGREDSLSGNLIELALGIEYNLTEKFLVSMGYLFTHTGGLGKYQTDLSYSLPSNTIGGGFAYKINSMFEVNLSGSYTMYGEDTRNFSHDLGGQGYVFIPVTETYDKDVWIAAIGININLGAKK